MFDNNNNRLILGLSENTTEDRSCEQTWVTAHFIHMRLQTESSVKIDPQLHLSKFL